jgi:hypothetical protein
VFECVCTCPRMLIHGLISQNSARSVGLVRRPRSCKHTARTYTRDRHSGTCSSADEVRLPRSSKYRVGTCKRQRQERDNLHASNCQSNLGNLAQVFQEEENSRINRLPNHDHVDGALARNLAADSLEAHRNLRSNRPQNERLHPLHVPSKNLHSKYSKHTEGFSNVCR